MENDVNPNPNQGENLVLLLVLILFLVAVLACNITIIKKSEGAAKRAPDKRLEAVLKFNNIKNLKDTCRYSQK